MRELVSIIVPVFNGEQFLEYCINSIQKQSYENIEVIIVDDGSTDKTSLICEKLEEKDKRIRVVRKVNEGPAMARKVGMEYANGEYTLFVDSDDWIESDMIKDLLNIAVKNDADIVTSGCYKDNGSVQTEILDSIEEGLYDSNKEYIYRKLIYNEEEKKRGITPYLFNKLMKTNNVRKIMLQMDEMISVAEDAAVLYSYISMANKIIVTHKIYYHYVMRQNSIVHSTNKFFFRDINYVYLFLEEYFSKSIYREILRKQLDLFMVRLCYSGMNFQFGLSSDVTIPYYDFPQGKIGINKKIVIYGAGRVGQSYYKQIKFHKLNEIVGWIDQRYGEYQKSGLDVETVDIIRNIEFDIIIIAVMSEKLAETIRQELLDSYKIKKRKIIWFKPVGILEKYIN